MRVFVAVLTVLVFVVGFSVVVNAHIGPTFFAQQVDPTTITIDGKDNDPGWNAPWWDDANTITADLLGGDVTGGEFPSVDDWDGILKVGWSAPPDNMLYFFSRVKDDILNDESPDNGNSWKDDNLEVIIDADHQGGDYNDPRGEIAQQFGHRANPLPAGPGSNSNNTQSFMWDSDTGRGWAAGPPWEVSALDPPVGRTNVTYAYEVKMALWDILRLTPETSVRHMNQIDQTIGLTFQWDDSDAELDTRDDQPGTQGPEGPNSWTDANQISDFVLIGGPGVTAVNATSWGAIKATFQR